MFVRLFYFFDLQTQQIVEVAGLLLYAVAREQCEIANAKFEISLFF